LKNRKALNHLKIILAWRIMRKSKIWFSVFPISGILLLGLCFTPNPGQAPGNTIDFNRATNSQIYIWLSKVNENNFEIYSPFRTENNIRLETRIFYVILPLANLCSKAYSDFYFYSAKFQLSFKKDLHHSYLLVDIPPPFISTGFC
jgi:hypothetical protein